MVVSLGISGWTGFVPTKSVGQVSSLNSFHWMTFDQTRFVIGQPAFFSIQKKNTARNVLTLEIDPKKISEAKVFFFHFFIKMGRIPRLVIFLEFFLVYMSSPLLKESSQMAFESSLLSSMMGPFTSAMWPTPLILVPFPQNSQKTKKWPHVCYGLIPKVNKWV